MKVFEHAREKAALLANSDDAALWRWFSEMLEERRITFRFESNRWLVRIDRQHIASAPDVDSAIRAAKTATNIDLGHRFAA